MTLVVKKISNGRFQFALITGTGRFVAAGAPDSGQPSATELVASIRRHLSNTDNVRRTP